VVKNMIYDKRNCEECNKEFIPIGKNQYGIQKFCNKKCQQKNRNKKARLKKITRPKKENKTSLNEKLIIEQSQNGLNSELKAIKLYQKLSEDIFVKMRCDRIKKYKDNTQFFILEIMENCCNHLGKELFEINKNKQEKKEYNKLNNKRKVIDIG